jgi:hypothetical protein
LLLRQRVPVGRCDDLHIARSAQHGKGIAVSCSTPSPPCAVKWARRRPNPTLLRQLLKLLRTLLNVASSR